MEIEAWKDWAKLDRKGDDERGKWPHLATFGIHSLGLHVDDIIHAIRKTFLLLSKSKAPMEDF